jgi:hypothetical protein
MKVSVNARCRRIRAGAFCQNVHRKRPNQANRQGSLESVFFMSPIRKRLLIATIILVMIANLLVGPGRLYGIVRSRQMDGQVVKILPYGKSEGTAVDVYLVEILVDANSVFLTLSSDPQWLMVAPQERVRVRLYPSPPWMVGAGPWQNALLISKLTEPPAPQVAAQAAVGLTALPLAPPIAPAPGAVAAHLLPSPAPPVAASPAPPATALPATPAAAPAAPPPAAPIAAPPIPPAAAAAPPG